MKCFKSLMILLLVEALIFVLAAPAFAAASFNSTLSAFPLSYRASLTELHNLHPNWTFTPIDTGLDFYSSVNAEYGVRSNVHNASAYTDMLKSMQIGDYNYSKGSYIIKDSGFVTASELAISYFMDPRNFLTEEGIFQFKQLSFSNNITVNDVEVALRGSFMSYAKASYLNTQGKTVSVDKTYSQIIYAAGKKYNIDPCFLASKIIVEVGMSGSASTSGRQADYPGYYNFFNINAASASNAAAAGLAYAASGGSFSRPWTSPERSINGGAEILASRYISVGQDTNYFQKFNVKPEASKAPYTHQYMTSIGSAAGTGYSTFNSEKASGTINNKYNFLIPIYNNMPAVSNSSGSISLLDSTGQVGTVTKSAKLRSAANEYSSVIATVPAGQKVNILASVKTTSKFPTSFLKYPFWAKVTYNANGKSYSGYLYYNFVARNTATLALAGSNITPLVNKTNNALSFHYLSRNVNVAQVVDGKIKFLKPGIVDIYAFDSLGHFSCVRYKVVDSITGKTVTGIKANKVTATSVNVTFTKNNNYSSYRIHIQNAKGKVVKTVSTVKTSVTITGLSENTKYKIFVRGINGNTVSPQKSAVSFTTSFATPATPGKFKQTSVNATSAKLTWSKVANATGYQIFIKNPSTGKYELKATVKAASYTLKGLKKSTTTCVKMRSYRTCAGKNYYSAYTSVLKIKK